MRSQRPCLKGPGPGQKQEKSAYGTERNSCLNLVHTLSLEVPIEKREFSVFGGASNPSGLRPTSLLSHRGPKYYEPGPARSSWL